MAEYSCVRCLFCNTGRENAVVRSVEQNGWGRAIFAERVKTIRRDGQTIETLVPLLPGYVFVYSDEANTARRDELLGLRSVIRVLSYGAGGHDGPDGARPRICGLAMAGERENRFAEGTAGGRPD